MKRKLTARMSAGLIATFALVGVACEVEDPGDIDLPDVDVSVSPGDVDLPEIDGPDVDADVDFDADVDVAGPNDDAEANAEAEAEADAE